MWIYIFINVTRNSATADTARVDDEIDEIAYFTVRWKTRASFVYRVVPINHILT